MTQHQRYTLTQATRITPFGGHSGISVTIQNISDTDNVYVGGEGVSTSSFGASLSPAAGISIDLPGSTDGLYVVGDTSSAEIAVLTVGLN
jgi:hypothetical protein